MIAHLRGEILTVNGEFVVVDVNGVGYEVQCSRLAISSLKEGEPGSLTIYTEVRQESLKLYGFVDRMEREVFLLLQKVKGVGGRSARDLVSALEAREVLRAIGSGDIAKLQSVRGVGKKTAERIVLELKDRVAEYALPRLQEGSGAPYSARSSLDREREVQDALEALIALGFPRKEAQRAVDQALLKLSGDGQIGNSSNLVRLALQQI